ncbi:hypothetical protein ACIQOV_37805 [Kitasatospora sp. NPDC091257]|uniref:hypothetical protein n=1 Tax=Kitasatospora sp. NPDC091257 TaxID=3364084 RepID=UPI0038235431
MALAISRDAQIAALYEKLHHRSAILAGLTPDTPSHAEIRRLESSTSISPKAVLIGAAVILLLIWSAVR